MWKTILFNPLYLTIFMTMSFLAGCTLVKKPYQHPEIELPQRWQQTASSKDDTWPDMAWWKSFKSPSLTALIEKAKNANDDLKAAVARVQEAEQQARIAGSPLLPTIDFSAEASRMRATPGNTVLCIHKRTANCVSGSLTASYELDFWGKNLSAWESALALTAASYYEKETVALTVTSSVASTYFNVLSLQEQLSIARDNLANAEQVRDDIQKRFHQGLASAIDLSQQQSLVATLQAAIPPLTLQLIQQINALAILVGKTPESFALPKRTGGLAAIRTPIIRPGLPSELILRRPDIQFAEAQLIAANADINQARAILFPSISLTAAGGYASTALATLFRPYSAFWGLGTSLLQPIFHGGALIGALDYRKARYQELLHIYHKTVISAFSDVESALAAVRQTASEQAAQENAQRETKKTYLMTVAQLKTGLVDMDTMLITQQSLFAANNALVQAKLDRFQALVSLYKALGGGWKKEEMANTKSSVENLFKGLVNSNRSARP